MQVIHVLTDRDKAQVPIILKFLVEMKEQFLENDEMDEENYENELDEDTFEETDTQQLNGMSEMENDSREDEDDEMIDVRKDNEDNREQNSERFEAEYSSQYIPPSQGVLEEESDLSEDIHVQNGYGILHVNKSFIRPMINYFISNGRQTFRMAYLEAIQMSPAGSNLSKFVTSRVNNTFDVHSDQIMWEIVSPQLQTFLKEIDTVGVTLIPHQTPKKDVRLQFGSPLYCCHNVNGDAFISCFHNHVVYFIQNENPVTVSEICGQKDRSSRIELDKVQVASKTLLKNPAGLCCLQIGKYTQNRLFCEEILLIANSGYKNIIMVTSVQTQTSRPTISLSTVVYENQDWFQ